LTELFHSPDEGTPVTIGGVCCERGDEGKRRNWLKNYVEQHLVLVSHNESTVQANNGKKMSWVHRKEYVLKKRCRAWNPSK